MFTHLAIKAFNYRSSSDSTVLEKKERMRNVVDPIYTHGAIEYGALRHNLSIAFLALYFDACCLAQVSQAIKLTCIADI